MGAEMFDPLAGLEPAKNAAQRGGAEGEKIGDVDPAHGDDEQSWVLRVGRGALVQAEQEGGDTLGGRGAAGQEMGLAGPHIGTELAEEAAMQARIGGKQMVQPIMRQAVGAELGDGLGGACIGGGAELAETILAEGETDHHRTVMRRFGD